MKKFGSKLCSLLLCAAALFTLCALPAAADDYYTNPMPLIRISRSEMDAVKPGQEFVLTVSMAYNNCYQTVQSPKVTFTPSDAFMIVDATPTKVLDNFKRNETVTADIRLRALSTIESPIQSVAVSVEFSYDSGSGGLAGGKSTETVYIPVVTSTGVEGGKPMVSITRGEVSTVSPGQDVELHAYITNQSSSVLTSPTLTVTPCGELLNMDATKTRQLDSIQPGGTLDVPIRLKAASTVTAASLGVDLELKQGGLTVATETVYIPAVPGGNEAGGSTWTYATPNIILSQYHYGDAAEGDVLSVAAGSTFDLNFEFENTSSVFTVENIVVTVSPGEGFCIASGSDTAHYPTLRAGATQAQMVSIQAQPTAKIGSAKIDIRFSYEYVENSQRKNVTLSQTISIPIYQPDRFEVELPQLPEMVDAYSEMYLSLPYVNKGKSEVSNIRAEIISEDGAVTSINPVQNLGNFAAGASGTIDFIFTPQMSGAVEFSFRITYEDPNAREKVLEFPVSLMVNEPYYPSYDDPGIYDPGFIDEPQEKSGLPWWVWTAGGVVIAAAAVTTVALVRKKRAKAAGELSDFVWDEQATEDAGSDVGGQS